MHSRQRGTIVATELNLNTLNWVTLACPDCAAEVQVLEDDVQSCLLYTSDAADE